MQRIPLTGERGAGRFALIDDDDFELVSRHNWYLLETTRAGRANGPYAQASVWRDGHNTTILMHCLIMGGKGIDHANGDGLDNQRVNLRAATTSQNGANTRKYSRNNRGSAPSSQYKGVKWQKRKPPRRGGWRAMIGVDGKQRYLGSFATEEAAARAYDAAAIEQWGEFAYVNFPETGRAVQR